MEEHRIRSDRHLEAMGRDMRDVIYSDTLTTNIDANRMTRNQLTLTFRAHKVREWNFYDETKLMGDGALSYAKFTEPEIESVCGWVRDRLVGKYGKVVSPEELTELMNAEGSKIGTVVYIPEATEHFYHATTQFPTPLSMKLTAHGYFVEKLVNVKLFFITEQGLLIDFFFWRVAPSIPQGPAASSGELSLSSY